MCRVGERDGAALRKSVIRWHRNTDSTLGLILRSEGRETNLVLSGGTQNASCNRPSRTPATNLLVAPIMQLHVNVRHCLLKRAQSRRHDLCARYRRIANVQFRFTGLRERTHIGNRFVCSCENRASFFKNSRPASVSLTALPVRSNSSTPSSSSRSRIWRLTAGCET